MKTCTYTYIYHTYFCGVGWITERRRTHEHMYVYDIYIHRIGEVSSALNCVYIYISIQIYIYMNIYIYIYIHIYIYIYIYIYVLYMNIVYICIYINTYMYLYTHV